SMRSSRSQAGADIALADRFFGYKHYIDGNGELIHFAVMSIIARAMMRNKPDSYCQAHEVDTLGVSKMVRDLSNLYSLYGLAGAMPARLPPPRTNRRGQSATRAERAAGVIRKLYDDIMSTLSSRR